jgi:23S rRNA (cytosine1962-C5)-methyltransferase
MPPLVLFEDDHLLVINKPSGLSTHAPAPYAGEGIYDWLRHREPRWATLSILHRLDKDTSGVMVFGKTPQANQSLTAQFEQGTVSKRYLLLTDRRPQRASFTVRTALVRAGDRYLSRPSHAGASEAVTRFTVVSHERGRTLVRAEPLTGKTHQIRSHASAEGFPILGDALYGGTPNPRLCLHAARLAFRHPAMGDEMVFEVAPEFEKHPSVALREAFINPVETNACRLIHGASDGWPGWHVDRLGDYCLVESTTPPTAGEMDRLRSLLACVPGVSVRGVYHKQFDPQVRRVSKAESSPRLLLGEPAPPRFNVLENGVIYALSFQEGYSTGLFLDQRDNRRRLLTGRIAAGFPALGPGRSAPTLLNTFAYTCAFSVSAARAGWHTTSLDLSRKYLDWGRDNLTLNSLDPASQDFIFGDVFEWMKRLAKKGRQFDAIILDPPTFSQSKPHGTFRAEQDYAGLVRLVLPLLAPDGLLLASSNAARYPPEAFLEDVLGEVRRAGRRISQEHYVPQPPDFPICRQERAYLKTIWIRVLS